MTNARAINIFFDLNSNQYSVEEKGTAIYKIMMLETHMGFSKKRIADAIDWLVLNVMNFVGFRPLPASAAIRAIENREHEEDLNATFSGIMTMTMRRNYLGISKDDMIDILKWCWKQCFEWPEEK